VVLEGEVVLLPFARNSATAGTVTTYGVGGSEVLVVSMVVVVVMDSLFRLQF
jgi:hypothetical protein